MEHNQEQAAQGQSSLWKGERRAYSKSRNLILLHFVGPHQEVDEVSGSIALRVLLVGGVAHSNVVEAFHSHLQEQQQLCAAGRGLGASSTHCNTNSWLLIKTGEIILLSVVT